MSTLSIPRESAFKILKLALDIEKSRPHIEDRKVERLIKLIKKGFEELHVFEKRYYPATPDLGIMVLISPEEGEYVLGRYFVDRGGNESWRSIQGKEYAMDAIEFWMKLPME